jgi:hypothetical protein
MLEDELSDAPRGQVNRCGYLGNRYAGPIGHPHGLIALREVIARHRVEARSVEGLEVCGPSLGGEQSVQDSSSYAGWGPEGQRRGACREAETRTRAEVLGTEGLRAVPARVFIGAAFGSVLLAGLLGSRPIGRGANPAGAAKNARRVSLRWKCSRSRSRSF